MKKTLVAVVLAVGLMWCQVANAQPGPMGMGGGKGRPAMGGPGGMAGDPLMQWGHFFKMLDEWGISDQQLTQIRAVFKKSIDQGVSLREEMKESHKQLQEAFRKGADPKDIPALAARQGEMVQKMTLMRLQTMSEIRQILTPEQIQKIFDRKGGKEQGKASWGRNFPYRTGDKPLENAPAPDPARK